MADIPERGFSDASLTGTNVQVPAITAFNVSSTSVWTANDARGVRFIAQKGGKVTEIGFYVGVSSGNVDMGIYDCAVTTRAKLFSSGTTACGTVNTWQAFAVTGVTVNEGDNFDVALAVDNGTVSVGRLAAPTNAGVQLNVAVKSPTGGGAGKMAWSIATSFPLPATLTETALVTTSVIIPHLYCVIQ
jgi:hypothetical protein